MKIYHYPQCSTCKKALKWLDAHGIDYKTIHIVEQPASSSQLKKWWKQSGLELKKFFNTSGKSYRDGGFGEKLKTMTEAEALDALAADGKLIKRPLLVTENTVLVGFKETEYQKEFN